MRAPSTFHAAFAIAALLVPLALAGCLSGGEEPTPAAAAPEDALTLTAPDDFSFVDNGTGDTDGRWHVHDYWGGEERILVLDQETGTHYTCSGCDEAVRFVEVRAEPKHVIPQGAAQVVVTASWQEERGSHAPFTLWVKSADQKEARDFGPIENGVPFTLNSTNEMNDPPHHVLSLWTFALGMTPPPGEDRSEFEGTVRFLVEAVRGLEIPPYPPHPDFWKGATELPLFEEGGGSTLQYESEGSMTCYLGCVGAHAPANGAIVPYDATEVVVTLTYGPGLPAGLGLRYHGADTWEPAQVVGEPAPGATTFRIPVSIQNADSPYAKQSLWEFAVFIDQATPVRAYSGSYTLAAKAVKA